MSASIPSTVVGAGSGPTTATVLSRTARAEWSRLWTVRSTGWFALATALTVLGIGTLLGIDVQGDPGAVHPDATAWRGGQLTATFGLYGLLALGVVAVTADHGTGGIVPSLQATPRRGILGTARTFVVVAFATLYGCLLAVGSSTVVYAFAPQLGLPPGTGVDVVAAVAFAHGASLLVAAGIGLLARSTASSLVAVLALMLVLPLMLGSLPFTWSRQVAELLPGNSAMFLLAGEAAVPMTEVTSYATLGVWAVMATVLGLARLMRSDAGH